MSWITFVLGTLCNVSLVAWRANRSSWIYGVRYELLLMMGLLLVLYVLSSIPAWIQLRHNTYRPLVCSTDHRPHIDFTAWNKPWMDLLYMVCCLLSMLFIFPKTPYIASYLYLTLGISYLLYRRSFASLWCWFAVLSPVVFASTESLPNFASRFSWLYRPD